MVDHFFFFFYHQLHQDSEYKENLHYAALRNHKTNRSRKKTDQTQSECVYSSVKEQRWRSGPKLSLFKLLWRFQKNVLYICLKLYKLQVCPLLIKTLWKYISGVCMKWPMLFQHRMMMMHVNNQAQHLKEKIHIHSCAFCPLNTLHAKLANHPSVLLNWHNIY